MAKSLQLKLAIVVHLFITGTVFAYAADAKEFVSGLDSIPLEAFQRVAALAFAAGSAATLIKVARPSVAVKNLPLEIVKDLFCSVLAGMLIFAFTNMAGLSMWPQFVLVLLAGFGGTQVLDMALAKGFFPWLSSLLGRLGGAVPPTPRSEDKPTINANDSTTPP